MEITALHTFLHQCVTLTMIVQYKAVHSLFTICKMSILSYISWLSFATLCGSVSGLKFGQQTRPYCLDILLMMTSHDDGISHRLNIKPRRVILCQKQFFTCVVILGESFTTSKDHNISSLSYSGLAINKYIKY